MAAMKLPGAEGSTAAMESSFAASSTCDSSRAAAADLESSAAVRTVAEARTAAATKTSGRQTSRRNVGCMGGPQESGCEGHVVPCPASAVKAHAGDAVSADE